MQTALATLKTDQIIQEIQAIQPTTPCAPPLMMSVLEATKWEPRKPRHLPQSMAGKVTFGCQAAARERAEALQKAYDRDAKKDEIGLCLADLFIAFPVQGISQQDQRARINVFVRVLEGMPLAAVQTACQRWVRGECGNENSSFAPTPPELLREVRRANGEAIGCINALRNFAALQAPQEERPPKGSQKEQEMRVRVEKILAETLGILTSNPEDEKKKPRDITPASMHAELYAMAEQNQSGLSRKKKENAA